MSLTHPPLRQLADVNLRYNKGVRPRADAPGADRWTCARLGGVGDCEDIAIGKATALVSTGWPADDLRLATCWTPEGTYHCVLTVDTAEDTLVLDNLSDRVSSWAALTRLGYRWHKRQDATGDGWSLIA